MSLIESLETRRLLSAGFLDPSFGSNGTVTAHYNAANDGVSTTLQADGKIIVVGDTQATGGNKQAFIARYNANGSVDTSYGTNGVTFLSVTAGADTIATGVAIDPTTGNAVVCGVSGSGLSGTGWVARYTTAGQLDTSFAGGTGDETLNFGGSEAAATGVMVRSTGSIAVSGAALQGLGSGFAIAILNPDGSAFTGFGGSGSNIFDPAPGELAVATGIAPTVLQGRFVESGFIANLATGTLQFAVAEFNPDASVAIHFGNNGVATASFGHNIEPALKVIVDPTTNTIIAAGATSNGAVAFAPGLPSAGSQGHATFADFAVARFSDTGTLVTSFNGTGMATVGFTGTAGKADIAGASDLVLQSDGKIVLSGGAEDTKTGQSNFASARFTSSGALDSTFGSGGTQQTDFGASDGAFGMTIQPNDQVIEVGHTKVNTTNSSVAMLRYTNDASTITGPPTPTASLTPTLSATLPPAVIGGSKATGFHGAVRITNSGKAAATGTETVNLYLAPAQTLDTTVDTALTPLTVHVNLKPNASMNVPLKLGTFPNVNGKFFLLAQLSGSGAAAGNVSASTGTVTIAPAFIDLAASSASVKPLSVSPGKKITIGVNVTNNGNEAAKGSLGVQLATSASSTGANPTAAGSPLSAAINIPAGKSKLLHATLTVPSSFPAGSYFMVVTVDPANTFNETTLANNTAVATVALTVV